jgi:hypothetical protein
MLYQPRNDGILFTFFGISLTSKRRSRSNEIRFTVSNKNKLYRMFGEPTPRNCPVLLRDFKDSKYPFRQEYPDFKDRPRWREFRVSRYDALGVVFHLHEFYAYADKSNKEFDFYNAVSLIDRQSDTDEDIERLRTARTPVVDFWDHLPLNRQAIFCRDALVKYDAMLAIDEKGDVLHTYPHIFVDFDARRGPFAWFFEYLKLGQGYAPYEPMLSDWKRIEIFPKEFPETKIERRGVCMSTDWKEPESFTMSMDNTNF